MSINTKFINTTRFILIGKIIGLFLPPSCIVVNFKYSTNYINYDICSLRGKKRTKRKCLWSFHLFNNWSVISIHGYERLGFTSNAGCGRFLGFLRNVKFFWLVIVLGLKQSNVVIQILMEKVLRIERDNNMIATWNTPPTDS